MLTTPDGQTGQFGNIQFNIHILEDLEKNNNYDSLQPVTELQLAPTQHLTLTLAQHHANVISVELMPVIRTQLKCALMMLTHF